MKRLTLCGALLLTALAVTAWLLRGDPPSPWALMPLMIAVGAYLLAIPAASKLPWPRAMWLILGVAVAGRLIAFSMPFVLSDDVYRYYWDGQIQQHGFNPYIHPPSSPALDPLRDEIWELSAHKDVPTMYPPLMLRVCHAGSVLGSGPWIFKLIFAGADLVALWFLTKLLRIHGRNPSLAVIWAWSPLVIVEFAGMGHGMSMAIAYFMAGVLLLSATPNVRAGASCSCVTKHLVGAGVAFAASVLSHYFAAPLVVAVVCTRRLTNWRFWLAFVVPLLLFFAMFADAGHNIITGFLHFSARWRFNGSLFELMAWISGDTGSQREFFGMWVAYPWIKIISALALLGVIGWTAWRRYDPAHAAWWTAGAILLLSPTVHPWYVAWMLALGCLWLRWSWTVFSGLVLLSYATKLAEWQTGAWQEATWARWAAYLPLLALISWEISRNRFDRLQGRL